MSTPRVLYHLDPCPILQIFLKLCHLFELTEKNKRIQFSALLKKEHFMDTDQFLGQSVCADSKQ